MKICFLMPSHWSGGLGGAEVQVRHIMDYMRQRTAHDLTMVCRNTKMGVEHGVPIYRTSPLWPFGRFFKAADYFSVRKLLRRLKPDVVYTRRGTPLVGFAADYCRRFNKRLVFHIAHVEDVTRARFHASHSIPKRLERPLYEYGLRRADVIVAQAKYQATLLQQNYGLFCTAIVPNFHPAPELVQKDPDMRTVMWVANIRSVKRPEIFINLARHCESIENTEFVMIGALHDRRYGKILKEASELRNFRYLGPQPLETVNRHLESGHLFVSTSREDSEGFPNSFIQAWLRGVPVVSVDVDPDEMLKEYGLGICCDGSFDRLVSVVKALLANSDELQLLASGVRDTAMDMYSEQNCANLIKLIEGESLEFVDLGQTGLGRGVSSASTPPTDR